MATTPLRTPSDLAAMAKAIAAKTRELNKSTTVASGAVVGGPGPVRPGTGQPAQPGGQTA